VREVEGSELENGASRVGDSRWGRIVVRAEEVLFALMLAAFLVAGLLPIVARYVGFTSAAWTGTLSQQLVLWVALFGAGAATRDRKHIKIDALSQFFPARGRVVLQAATQGFAAVVCAVLSWVSLLFVWDEIELSGDALSPLGVPASWLSAVLPAGFLLLTVRLLIAAWFDAREAFRPGTKREET